MKISPFVFALTTMICWGTAPLFGKAAMLRIDPWMGLAVRSFIISFIMLIWAVGAGQIHRLFRMEATTWALICGEGILASLLGHLAYFYAIKYGTVSRVVPIASAFPMVVLLGGVLLYSERMSWERMVGTIMIVVGIILVRR